MSSMVAEEFIEQAKSRSVIDVRSPAEFKQGHIPDAHNVPLLNDQERALVGTTYKQAGRETAVALGRGIVTPKMANIVQAVRDITTDREILVHCWRGGMRSECVARLLQTDGFETKLLQGGYKSYRRSAREAFAKPWRIVILSGLTGTGKTKLLELLRDAGEQVVDLEAPANHRGSAFGGIGQPPQPTVEQFENQLYDDLRAFDIGRVVWMESENQMVGNVAVPETLWDRMLLAPAVNVHASRSTRVEFLIEEYGNLPAEDLGMAVTRIKKRLGGLRVKQAIEALDQGDLALVVETVLEYYDKAYDRANVKYPRPFSADVQLAHPGDQNVLAELIRVGAEVVDSAEASSGVG